MTAMRASLFRTASLPVQKPLIPGFLKYSLSPHASLSGDKFFRHSPTVSLNFLSPDHRDTPPRTINRALSENDAIRSATEDFGLSRKIDRTGIRSFPATVSDEEFLSDSELHDIRDKSNCAGVWSEIEEFGFGGGIGSRCDHGIATINGGNAGDRIKIGAYYEEMLKSNPTNALLLGNYGKFLYEVTSRVSNFTRIVHNLSENYSGNDYNSTIWVQVEKDAVRAEEYYGRAILANPGDGELFSLYGKLVWETQRDEGRAKSYFEHAVHAFPDNWYFISSSSPFKSIHTNRL